MFLHNYPRFKQYLHRHLLALDYGKKVIGLSTFTPGQDPFPLAHGKIIVPNTKEELFKKLTKIVDEENIEIIILGIPYLLDGSSSPMTEKIKKFKHELSLHFIDKIILEQDETLTTFAAKDRMKTSPSFHFKVDYKSIDTVSAVIILEDFIKDTSENSPL